MIKKLTLTVATIFIITFSLLFNTQSVYASDYYLDDEQKEIAKKISEICTDRWEECGVLPSVCIAQAYMESHIGKYCYENNLWGLYGGYTSFDTLEDGINAYIDTINNGYYDEALWHTNSDYVIDAIWDGGYCTTDKDTYCGGVKWIIDEFDLTRYDKEILKNCYMRTYENCENWKYISE